MVTRPRLGRDRRRGFVLLLVLLAVLALTLLAHGLLALAQAQRRGGHEAWLARSRSWAARTLAASEARAMDSVSTADVTTRAVAWSGGQGAVTVRRLSAEVALLEVRVDSGGGATHAGALLWSARADMRVAELPRAAAVGVWPDMASLDRVSVTVETCPPETLPDAGGRPLTALRPVEDRGPPGRPPTLGHLDEDEWSRRLALLPGPAGTPSPTVQDGVCVAGAWNWGDPGDPGGPCSGRFVAARAATDLRLAGGAGQGLVVTGGSLTLDGTAFHGLLVAGGDVILEGEARVEGVVVASGTLVVGGEARLVGRPCAAFAALGSGDVAAALRTPVVMPAPGWVLY